MSSCSTLFELGERYGFAEALAEVSADLAARLEAEAAAAREAGRCRLAIVEPSPRAELRALLRSAVPAARAAAA